jgi:ParB/Sulfiredoxin domain
MKTKITDIKVGSRYRKDLGDLTLLANSIGEIGLLHPIVVNQDNQLIAGERRLEACKSLGLNEVDVHLVNIHDLLMLKKGELHENGLRKDFTISEAVEIKRALEPEIKAETPVGRPNKNCANLAQLTGEKTRDKVADFLGVSHGQLDKMEKIVEGVEQGLIPEETLEKIDNGKTTINKVNQKLQIERIRQEFVNEAAKIELAGQDACADRLSGTFRDPWTIRNRTG